MKGPGIWPLDASRLKIAGYACARLQSEHGASLEDALRTVIEVCRKDYGTGHSRSEADVFARHEAALGWRWACSSFATVVIGHKLAASFCATSIPDDPAMDVPLAWPCFRIRVPDGLLSTASIFVWRGRQGSIDIEKMTTQENRERVGVCTLYTASHLVKFGFEPTVVGYASLEFDESTMRSGGTGPNLDKLDAIVRGDAHQREALLIGRLLVGVCLELAQPRLSEQIDSERVRRAKRLRASAKPVAWLFKLGREVKIDARPYVRDFLDGNARSVHVQSLVRGHHKMQAHGPQNSLRKLIHVEPYWRGPEDAPIVVRDHGLDGGP